ncbi:MAG: hypothetical protein GYA34_06845 [Chloroflexi bacterium]|nr:hypothetical protein [Chloroflexota bacterium]
MKAFINERKCPAKDEICLVLTSCPQNAIAYHPDKAARMGGRIEIDLDRCDGCGQCVADCCGKAIELR